MLNGLEGRASVLPVAASNKTGKATLVVDPEQGGQNWIATDKSKLKRRGQNEKAIRVPTVTLDELVENGSIAEPSAVGLLWMDAQAHEGHILEGASTLVRQGVPVILEWDPQGLDRLGDRSKIESIAGDHYTHFLDMRPRLTGKRPRFELRSSAALADYAEPFEEKGGRGFTDILMLRIPKRTAAALNVVEVIASHVEREAKQTLVDTLDDEEKLVRNRRRKRLPEAEAKRERKRLPEAESKRERKRSPEAEAKREAKRVDRPKRRRHPKTP